MTIVKHLCQAVNKICVLRKWVRVNEEIQDGNKHCKENDVRVCMFSPWTVCLKFEDDVGLCY